MEASSTFEPDPVFELTASYRDLHVAMVRLIRPYAEASGLTMFQLRVLICLKQDALSLTELVDRTHSYKGYVSSVVEELVAAGLVIRSRSETDRRSIVVQASETGRATLRNIFGPNTPFIQNVKRAFAMDAEDMEKLAQLHRRVIDNLATGGTAGL